MFLKIGIEFLFALSLIGIGLIWQTQTAKTTPTHLLNSLLTTVTIWIIAISLLWLTRAIYHIRKENEYRSAQSQQDNWRNNRI